jgi:hypothetical protein
LFAALKTGAESGRLSRDFICRLHTI